MLRLRIVYWRNDDPGVWRWPVGVGTTPRTIHAHTDVRGCQRRDRRASGVRPRPLHAGAPTATVLAEMRHRCCMYAMPVTHATQVRADVERNRAAIMTGAIGLLGVEPNASMQQIAEASGVNRATLYRHFASRDQLMSALHAKALDDSAEVARRLPADGPVVAALRAFLDDAITIGERYRFILMYHRTDPGLFDVEARATVPVLKAIRRGQEAGEIDPRLEPVFAAGQITMLVIGVIGLVERGAMTLEQARRQAQISFGNTLAVPVR